MYGDVVSINEINYKLGCLIIFNMLILFDIIGKVILRI